jgi:hypothetical protein
MDIGWPHLIGSSAGGSLLTWATLQLVPAVKARLENARRNGNAAGHGRVSPCAFNLDELESRVTQPLVDAQGRLTNTVERLVEKMDHLIEKMAEQRGFERGQSKIG